MRSPSTGSVVGRKPSGTPSPSVSTASVPVICCRWMSLLKNCVVVATSYVSPMSWSCVRLTKMIFALIATCGVRTSRSCT
jgi:hypothetical protein